MYERQFLYRHLDVFAFQYHDISNMGAALTSVVYSFSGTLLLTAYFMVASESLHGNKTIPKSPYEAFPMAELEMLPSVLQNFHESHFLWYNKFKVRLG